MDNYYVYEWLDENGVVIYVGKGVGNRAANHLKLARAHNRRTLRKNPTRFVLKLAKALREGRAYSWRIFAAELSSEAALKKEIELIAQHRRIEDGGTLLNITLGGDGVDPESARKATKKLWKDPKRKLRWKRMMRKANQSPKRREESRQKALREWENPKRKAQAKAKAEELWADPEWAEARRKELAERNKASAKAGSERMKALWADPVWAASMKKKMAEARERRKMEGSK